MKPTHTPHTPPHTPSHATSSRQLLSTRPTIRDLHASPNKMTIHNTARSELLCRYPSKLCDNMRSEKRGGGLHRFCAMHRERANINQRRVDHRRRLRRRGGAVASLTEKPYMKEALSSDDEDAHVDEMISLDMGLDNDDMNIPLCAALSEDDLQVLFALLDESSTDGCMLPSSSAFTLQHDAASEYA